MLGMAGLLTALLAVACDASAPDERPRVQFRVTNDVGPCSSDISIRFTSDGVILGEESFRIHLAPDRTESSQFRVPIGAHTLGAQITRWGNMTTSNGFAWPDTTVHLTANQLVVRAIDLYCS